VENKLEKELEEKIMRKGEKIKWKINLKEKKIGIKTIGKRCFQTFWITTNFAKSERRVRMARNGI
jgi:hypothetical protein